MNGTHLGVVQPISKRDQVVSLIRQAIIGGQLTAGDAIIESRIGPEIGAGTSLVREALIELEHQGFVRKIPYKGTYVNKLSRADFEDIFRLRRELESLAVEWAMLRITPADLERDYRLAGGHIFHGELALDQLFTMRPLLGYARYGTPIPESLG